MRFVISILIVALTLAFGSLDSQAQSWQPPPEKDRCPSKWGAQDQRGSGNHMNRESVLRAARLIRTGQTFELAHVMNSSMPVFGTRIFEMYTKPSVMNQGTNHRGSNEELVVSEIGQVGTHIDGLAHQTIGNMFYNCAKVDETATRSGFTKNGVENVGTLMSRGVLIDVAALKGVDMLSDTYEITVQDLQQALQKEKLQLQPGDAIIINTGWGRLWGKDNARYNKTSPGIGVMAAEWLAKQDPMLVGSDNSGVGVVPDRDPQVNNPVHQIMLVVNGIHLLENLKLDELASERVYEFALILEPLKMQGASGSTVAPVAIR